MQSKPSISLLHFQAKSPPMFPRQPTDFKLRLPKGWGANMSVFDQTWIGKNVFASKGNISTPLKNWYHPPDLIKGSKPTAGQYFARRLFLWMPRKMFAFDFKCINCDRSLRSKGLYNRVRIVLDVKDYYYLAAEYMDCNECSGTFIAWDARMLNQLPYGLRVKFPAVLTYRYACDYSVISLLRSRTLGNSPTALQANLCELHTDCWLKRNAEYLRDAIKHAEGLSFLHLPSQTYDEAEVFKVMPSAKWFLASYARDVWTRLEQLKAAITSVFGKILKIDATKKICRKLAGEVAKSASFALNVGNERSEIVQSILISSESILSLQPMADGLVKRYSNAGVDPPLILYTDRDCCSETGPSKFKVLFCSWNLLSVRLDIWHYMRRLALGCSSESHPLYGVFMSRLSGCIFEWDRDDYSKLTEAKKGELIASGIKNPSEEAICKSVTPTELSRHCRRRTRGEKETSSAIEDLILSLTSATDTLGVPLFNDEMVIIWKEQAKHVKCIQDLPDLPLYAVTHEITKGGKCLPVYRCARGTTSLESFHRHYNTFIPGTSANAVNFQAYLLDGITRWNASRKQAAVSSSLSLSLPSQSNLSSTIPSIRSFDIELISKVNDLNQKVHGKVLISREVPNKYTGEAIGLEFLYREAGMTFHSEDLDEQID